MCVPALYSTRQRSVLKLMLGYDNTADIRQQQQHNNNNTNNIYMDIWIILYMYYKILF